MVDGKGVLICGEMAPNGVPAFITLELMGVGRKLADARGEELSALIMGEGIYEQVGKELIAYGADKVYIVNDPLLARYHPDAYFLAVEQVCRRLSPSIFLMGRTEMGQDVAPLLAFRLGTGLCMDCLELRVDPQTGLMVMTRPVYGGNVWADYVCESTRPQMATIRPKTQDPAERDQSRRGEVIHVEVAINSLQLRSQLVEHQVWEEEGVSLESAEIVVGGGRGMGSQEAYKTFIEGVAKVLGGAAGATKAACDAGYAPMSNQIGLTGRRISPKLYVAVGISGASQHLAGIGSSRTVVAINKDPQANIFRVARYGVVGDYKQVMPSFIEKCKELVSQ